MSLLLWIIHILNCQPFSQGLQEKVVLIWNPSLITIQCTSFTACLFGVFKMYPLNSWIWISILWESLPSWYSRGRNLIYLKTNETNTVCRNRSGPLTPEIMNHAGEGQASCTAASVLSRNRPGKVIKAGLINPDYSMIWCKQRGQMMSCH